MMENKQTQAIQEYANVIRLEPQSDIAYYNMGNMHYTLTNYKEAIEAYNKSIGINPEYSYAHFNLANAYSKSGKHQEAIEELK